MQILGLSEVPGLFQTLVCLWVPDQGWLMARSSLIHGGRHGAAPEPGKEWTPWRVGQDAQMGVRAIESRLRQEGLL